MAKTRHIELLGDKVAANSLRQFAYKQADTLSEAMEFKSLTIGTRRVRFANGAEIVLSQVHGHMRVKIFSPPDAPALPQVSEVDVVEEFGDVVFTDPLCNDAFTTMPESFTCAVKNAGANSSYKLKGTNDTIPGANVVWRSAPDANGHIDVVCITGPQPGYGHCYIKVRSYVMQNHTSLYVSVNNLSATVDFGDTTFTPRGFQGACLRTVKGEKYLVIVAHNDANLWEFDNYTPTYDKATQFEARIYYAKYPDNTTSIPQGKYHKQDNPNGWRIAGDTELAVIHNNPGLEHLKGLYAYKIGLYMFAPEGDRAAQCYNPNYGLELRFHTDSWFFEQVVIKTAGEMAYISRPVFTEFYAHESVVGAPYGSTWVGSQTLTMVQKPYHGLCLALGYHNGELVGLFVGNPKQYRRTEGYGIVNHHLDIGEKIVNEFVLYFRSMSGVITKVYDRAIIGEQRGETCVDSRHVFTPNKYLRGKVDRYVDEKLGAGLSGGHPCTIADANTADDWSVGVCWLDITNLAVAFVLNNYPYKEINRCLGMKQYQGFYVWMSGTLRYSYLTRYRDYDKTGKASWDNGTGSWLSPGERDHYQFVRFYYDNRNRGYFTLAERGTPHSNYTTFSPLTRMQFAVIGDSIVGQLVGPIGNVQDNDGFYPFDITEQIEGHGGGAFWSRVRAGIFPEEVDEAFAGLAQVKDYTKEWDCYRNVFPANVMRYHTIELFDSDNNFLGVKS